MPDFLQSLLSYLPVDAQYLPVLLAVLVALVLLVLFRRPLHHCWQEQRIARALKRMGARVMDNVHLPDGLGGEVMIDKLVLATDAILVINVKRFEGLIFGGANTDVWTQVINTRSYRFPSPEAYLQLQVNAVRAVAPKAVIRGLHLFTHGARFPKGKPPSVLLLAELERRAPRPRMKDIPAELRVAWEQVVDALS